MRLIQKVENAFHPMRAFPWDYPMPTELAILDVRKRPQWRKWLEGHHDSTSAIWLVFSKRHTAQECLSYDDAVEEALCFGWIDSIVRRLDEDRYARWRAQALAYIRRATAAGRSGKGGRSMWNLWRDHSLLVEIFLYQEKLEGLEGGTGGWLREWSLAWAGREAGERACGRCRGYLSPPRRTGNRPNPEQPL